jgi:hypothetical protein
MPTMNGTNIKRKLKLVRAKNQQEFISHSLSSEHIAQVAGNLLHASTLLKTSSFFIIRNRSYGPFTCPNKRATKNLSHKIMFATKIRI